MTAGQTFVVLGGAGRLGRHLLPVLRAQGHRVIGVSRSPADDSPPDGWVCADLTTAAQWASVQDQLLDLLGGAGEVVLVDLVLDRTSVASMRRSISAATTFTVRTRRLLAAEGHAVRVLAAGTTAALAPLGFQTPYGRAKRQQAVHYARLECVDLVLLPQLVGTAKPDRSGDQPGAVVGNSCTYEAAAVALHAIGHHPARRSLWVVRGGDPQPYVHRGIAGLPGALGSLVLSHTVGRNSPTAHRRASRERLALLPPRIRAGVDHHGAPERLVRAFERYLDMPRARTVIVGDQPARSKEDDEQYP